MPNICENYVRIRGSREALSQIVEAEFEMEKLVPWPEEITRGSDAWWEWVQENWSTKWISNDARDGPPEIVDHGESLESHFNSAWFFPFSFYKGLVCRLPSLTIEYQYSCWETGFIGYGTMRIDNVDDEPHHYSYDTPAELNESIRSNEGCWKVWTGNPHFDYDESTGLYDWIGGVEPEPYKGGGAAAGAAAEGDDTATEDSEPLPRPPLPVKVVKKKKD
jgi:hypothetical protein